MPFSDSTTMFPVPATNAPHHVRLEEGPQDTREQGGGDQGEGGGHLPDRQEHEQDQGQQVERGDAVDRAEALELDVLADGVDHVRALDQADHQDHDEGDRERRQ